MLNNEVDTEGYDEIRMNRSMRGGGVTCYIRKHYLIITSHVFVLPLKAFL